MNHITSLLTIINSHESTGYTARETSICGRTAIDIFFKSRHIGIIHSLLPNTFGALALDYRKLENVVSRILPSMREDYESYELMTYEIGSIQTADVLRFGVTSPEFVFGHPIIDERDQSFVSCRDEALGED
jgi:hypothetical protein